MTSNKVTLISNPICPFAHRVWLTLLEKKVDFQFKEASLTNKQPWFTETYKKAYGADPASDGKVPILIHGDKILAESDLISWYLAQTFPTGNNLIPEDTFDRLRLRRFIQEVTGKAISAFYTTKKFSSKTEEEKKKILQTINKSFELIQKQIVGPYALGEQFSLADILLYPWFDRWVVNQSYYGLFIPKEFTKIHQFIRAFKARPSAQKTRQNVSDQYYIDGYAAYHS